jgi:hypothetical protein
MPDYLPRTDTEFDRWFEGFVQYSLAHGDELGLSIYEIAELRAVRSAWDAAYARHQAAQEAARSATVMKEMTRVAGEQTIRKYVRIIQARPATTNGQRRALGITLKPGEPRSDGILPAIAPPGAMFDTVGY